MKDLNEKQTKNWKEYTQEKQIKEFNDVIKKYFNDDNIFYVIANTEESAKQVFEELKNERKITDTV